MQSAVIFLGAGRPFQGDEHAALRSASGPVRVIDWLIHATDSLMSSVHFVGGYRLESIRERYPELLYWVNDDWHCTRSAYSFLLVDLCQQHNCLVSYSDVLFRRSLATALSASQADICVAVDSQWRTRYAGRTQADLLRCEKVSLHNGSITRLGPDIPVPLATAEFVGCVHFGPRALAFLVEHQASLQAQFQLGNLSDLIEMLRCRGMQVEAIDVLGDWAELNEPRDLAHFILGTKAQTLRRLRRMVKCSRIEDQVSFTVAEWHDNRHPVLAGIQQHFPGQRLVIRSSALSEDGFSHSNAGAYASLLDIDGSDLSALHAAIEHVIASYPDSNPHNQVLIQPMLEEVFASGVAFTRSLSSGAPYYLVNYDDVSGSTESITSGSSDQHKTLVMRRDADAASANIPQHLAGLLPALREIEALLGHDSLDVEFAITRSAGLHVLQVRPIAVDHSQREGDDAGLFGHLDAARADFAARQKAPPFTVGSRALFGIMPDWNPAEIIGTTPQPLAVSLYRQLIMNETWATQRAEYGYRDVRPSPLLIDFAGHPYVDIRASFNSFIPASLDDGLATRLADFYLDWLERHPWLHDKVEFEVVPTCFSLDFEHWRQRLAEEGGFLDSEIDQLRDALRQLSADAILRNTGDLARIAKLERRFQHLRQQPMPHLEKIRALLFDCRQYGTLPFAHLARSAFVAVTLLRSAVSSGVISTAEMEDFLASIRTVGHELGHDAQRCARGELDWQAFVDKYGHLRPGTYDINCPSYRADPERYLRPIINSAITQPDAAGEQAGRLWQRARPRFVAALAEAGLAQDADTLEQFLRQAIEGREYAKFAFTRNLSLALDELVEWGEALGLPRDRLAYLDIDALLASGNDTAVPTTLTQSLGETARRNQALHQQQRIIELPPLLCRDEDLSVFLYPATQPNFVGTARIRAACVVIGEGDDGLDLSGKIALIQQADPGYDWLFGRQIAGLITLYGGANSHMAIRAAEFGLPAALGVGETRYRTLAAASVLELDAGNRTLRVIQ